MKRCLAIALACFGSAVVSQAQTIDPYYSGSYSFVDLGPAPDVPANYGGVCLSPNSNDELLLGGAANGSNGAIYNVGVHRSMIDGKMRIDGFQNTTSLFSSATNIDGGLLVAPNGNVMFTGYSNNIIGEIKPGSTTPDRITTLPFGNSVGSLMFVPAGSPGAGRLKILSYNQSIWYDVPFALDSDGLYTFGTPTTQVQLSGGLEGVVYVPSGSDLFPNASILVAEYGTGNIVSYEVDSNGDPVVSSRRIFVSGLSGAEGSMIDPTTGDFIFSTYGGGNHLVSVRGFASVPEPMSLSLLGMGAFALFRRRRSK